MKILFLESDQMQEYNCSNWRCLMPARALNRAGHQAVVIRVEDWVNRTPEAVALTEQADIVIFQRNLFMEAMMTIAYWRARGKVIAIDLDDAYEHMTEETGSPSYKFWKKNLVEQKQPDGTTKEIEVHPRPIDVLKYGCKLAGAVTSPSKLICADWQPYTRSYWFPNYVDLSLYRRFNNHREPGQIRIGWGGSMTHLVSWTASGANAAMVRIVKEFPNVLLVLLGDPRVERFFNEIPPKKRAALGYVPHAIFSSKLSYVDIGLIPLHGEYDRRRSWLKTAEYSVMGIPWIGTDAEPTQEIDTGTRVLNTADAWYETIKTYILNYESVAEAARRNVPMANEFFGIDSHVPDLIKTFERIIQETK